MLFLFGGILMADMDQLRDLVARMLQVRPDEVLPETSLVGLDTSIGGARLQLGLKRLGLSLPAGFRPANFEVLRLQSLPRGSSRKKRRFMIPPGRRPFSRRHNPLTRSESGWISRT